MESNKTIRAKEGDELSYLKRNGQQKLFSHLNNQGITIERGYLMKSEGVFHEKGVDVKIAVDLLVGAYEDIYDVALLISSDTDLIPAIRKIRQLGKKLKYIGFIHNPSFALKKNASSFRLINREDLMPFIRA